MQSTQHKSANYANNPQKMHRLKKKIKFKFKLKLIKKIIEIKIL